MTALSDHLVGLKGAHYAVVTGQHIGEKAVQYLAKASDVLVEVVSPEPNVLVVVTKMPWLDGLSIPLATMLMDLCWTIEETPQGTGSVTVFIHKAEETDGG